MHWWLRAAATARQRARFGALAIFLALPMLAAPGWAEGMPKPFQLSWVPGFQVFPQEDAIWGLSLNVLYGIQHDVTGLNLGPFAEATRLRGVAISIVNTSREYVRGVHMGGGNAVEGHLAGLQFGGANLVEGDLEGMQLGIANSAGGGAGFQLGMVNHTTSMKGLQIGLLNFNEKGWLRFFPIFNFDF
jgi:hypothetical protein